MSEVGDVIDLLWSYERQNHVFLVVRLETMMNRGTPDLEITIEAYPTVDDRQGVKPLVLASVTCSAMHLTFLRDAVTRALYIVDGKLANIELGNSGG